MRARRRAARGQAVPPDPQGPQPPADAGGRQRHPDQPGRRGARAGRPRRASRARSRRTFSLGMGQRLGLAAALLGDPHTLILDEPANGLDPQGIQWIRQLLKALAATGRSVFVSSHLLSEMALMADQLVVIGRGPADRQRPGRGLRRRSSRRNAGRRCARRRPPTLADAARWPGGRRRGRRRAGRGVGHRPRRAADRRPGVRRTGIRLHELSQPGRPPWRRRSWRRTGGAEEFQAHRSRRGSPA